MDTATLVEQAKARFKHHESKLYLQEKYKNKLTFASQGGLWTASIEFLSFLNSAPATCILPDNFGNPIKIDSGQLKKEAWDLFNAAMADWHAEYTELQKNR